MLLLTSDVGLEPGLPVDQIESRLIDAARRHHLEERNIAYWLLELDRRRLYQAPGDEEARWDFEIVEQVDVAAQANARCVLASGHIAQRWASTVHELPSLGMDVEREEHGDPALVGPRLRYQSFSSGYLGGDRAQRFL